MKRTVLAVAVFLLRLPAVAGAQPFPERDLPPELRPWVPWVRDEVPDSVCPAVHGSVVCMWPGRLGLRLAASGGTFALEANADREIDLRLPGDAQSWPQDVRMDGRSAAVGERGGGPAVRLSPGAHRLDGRFGWTHLPDSLAVPPTLGLVDLAIDGQAVTLPRRDEAGLVWLRAGGEAAGAAESLRLQAFRRIADGIPLWVETYLSLEVSGKAREIELRGALLPGSVPVMVSGDLPARLDGDRLRVQARAGSFGVSVLARLEDRPTTLAVPPVTEPWPAREVWVFAADERLRQVELSGLGPVDPSRTDLPAAWRKLPAFVAEPGSHLAVKEVRRGEPEAPPDRIQLHREMWLDLAGRGFTIRDVFAGALSRTWRLDLEPPGELGRAALDRVDQLITANPATQAAGVELRRGALQLQADSRLFRSARVPAVGWSADVERLAATLHLPPGWWLLGATGVDSAPGAWTSRWTLLAFFFVLIVALATGRLFGRGWGVVALLAVALSYDEPQAPFLVWLSLLGAIGLGTVAPEGRLRALARFWRGASLLALLMILAPFVRDQVRDALYPQVADESRAAPARFDVPFPFLLARRAAHPTPAPPMAPMPQAAQEQVQVAPAESDEERLEGGVAGGVPGGVVGGTAGSLADEPKKAAATNAAPRARALGKSYASSSSVALEQDPRAVLQTGPGMPTWAWRSYQLSWSGPVERSQTVRLYLVSPGWSRMIALLRLLFLFLFAIRLLVGQVSPAGSAAPSVALAFALLALVPTGAQAGEAGTEPSRALLDEMKRRLTRPQPCQPDCISTSALRVRLSDGTLVFEAEVHAADAGAWAIPGPATTWAPAQVRVDSQTTNAIARLADGFLYVRLGPGVHRVEASGPTPRADTVTLQLKDRPHHATADAPGWEVSGLRADGPPETSIQLNRRLRVGEHAREAAGHYAPWLEVTRTLSLGLTWGVRTQVHRVSPSGAPVSLRIPLLTGEAPTDADIEVKDGAALLSMGRDQIDAGWSSTLTTSEALALKAAEGQPWSEVWRLECGLIWQCDAEGLAPVARERQGVLAPEYRPWPGESLALRFRHPQAVAGQTVTLDALRLETTPGDRLTTTVLTLMARASREEPLVLNLPADADVQEVTVGGVPKPARPDRGQLRVTLSAGAQPVMVRWRQAHGMSLYHRVPTVGLTLPAVNAEVVLHIPDNRWLLLVRGPSWGPAVLFWGYLLFALFVALGLGLLAETPLGIGEWLLLTLGLTQVPAVQGLVVAGLFLALAWRAAHPRAAALSHNSIQALLVVWTIAALVALYGVVETGLLLRPDMQVAGAGSHNTLLRWYADRITQATPSAGVLSLPLWLYRGLMLAWALWLASRLLRWAAWAWRAFSVGGLWRPLPRPPKPTPAGEAAPPKESSDATPPVP